MITVTERVFEHDKLIHESKQEWPLKSRFLNEFRKLPDVTGFVIYDLQRSNKATLEMNNGIRREIEIAPKIAMTSNG